MFGKIKQLANKVQATRKSFREQKFSKKKALLAKEQTKAKQRAEIANLDKKIKAAKKSNPSKGTKLLKNLGAGALKAGRSAAMNSRKKQAKNMSWLGGSPMTKGTTGTPAILQGASKQEIKPRKKRVKIIEYE